MAETSAGDQYGHPRRRPETVYHGRGGDIFLLVSYLDPVVLLSLSMFVAFACVPYNRHVLFIPVRLLCCDGNWAMLDHYR